MLPFVLEVLAGWIAASMIVGAITGALLHSSERVHSEKTLDSLFSFLAKRQSTK